MPRGSTMVGGATMGASVAALLSDAGEHKLVVEGKRRRPWGDARLLVDVTSEWYLAVTARMNRQLKRISTGAGKFDIVAIVRPVARDHRLERAARFLSGIQILHSVLDMEIG